MAMTKSKPQRAKAPVAEVGEVLTLAEAAAYLRVGQTEVLQAVRDQGLPARKLGREWRFFTPALQDWLKAPRQKKGILAHIGAFKDDPTLPEMLKEVYQRRGRPEAEEG